jgi:hypothetical protein
MPDPNINSALYVSPNRNYSIPFNYVWDDANQYWTPMQKGDCGSYSDSITASAKDYIHKFGSNPNISNTVSVSNPETIWDGSSEYTFPPDEGTSIQIKSNNAGDDQEVIIQGLDQYFNKQSWTGNLNGLSDVDIDGTWSRVFRAYNNDSTNFAGTIDIHQSGAPTSYAKILGANNQTLMSIYTVPADYTGYMIKYSISAHNAGSSSEIGYTLYIKTREYGKVFRVKEVSSVGTSSPITQKLPFPLILQPKTDIIFNVVSANGNNGAVNADFDIALL